MKHVVWFLYVLLLIVGHGICLVFINIDELLWRGYEHIVDWRDGL